jgi:hypothetical protein
MGFRFRRSIKLFPGMRLNLSKRGIGASVGFTGLHVSSGPSGSRVTTSIPGTGVSFVNQIPTSGKKKLKQAHSDTSQPTPPPTPPRRKLPQFIEDFINQDQIEASGFTRMLIKIVRFLAYAPKKLLIVLGILAVLVPCCIWGTLASSTPEYKMTATAQAFATTQAAMPTFTFTPSITPSFTVTFTPGPTFTPRPTLTLTPIFQPLPSSTAMVCICSRDYDCGEFLSQFAAQACFIQCGGSTSFDWSKLDNNGNGQACESYAY